MHSVVMEGSCNICGVPDQLEHPSIVKRNSRWLVVEGSDDSSTEENGGPGASAMPAGQISEANQSSSAEADSVVRAAFNHSLDISSPLAFTNTTDPLLEAGIVLRTPIQVVLKRELPGDILGFTCEADSKYPTCLRITSLSEHGLLGRYNMSAPPDLCVSEGSLILRANGVGGNVAELRKNLDAEPVELLVLLNSAGGFDKSGRRLALNNNGGGGGGGGAGFSKEDAGPSLGCRCNAQCKCGLIDALGKAGDVWSNPRRLPWCALSISNLRPDIDEEALYAFIASVSPVAHVRVVRNTTTWHSECHGFVNFYTFQDAQRALNSLNGCKLRGRRCYLSWSSRARGSNGAPPTNYCAQHPSAPWADWETLTSQEYQ